MAGPNLITLSLAIAFGAYIGPLIHPFLTEIPFSFLPSLSPLPFNLPRLPFLHSHPKENEPICPPHNYTTQLISLDPLLIYISSFISPSESESLISLGGPLLEPSPITGYGRGSGTLSASRTSWSAPLSPSDRTVSCILLRAQSFLGTLLSPGRDEMGLPQLVRYTEGQKFDLHTDWFAKPRIDDLDAERGRRRMYNRVATLFVVLKANHTAGGETWFPRVGIVAPQDWDSNWGGGEGEGPDANSGSAGEPAKESRSKSKSGSDPGPGSGSGSGSGSKSRRGKARVWREHEDGGLAFQAIPGGALFWVNMLPNGTGDARTVHAGLPVKGGVKYAMNIWPRAFFGPDA